MNDSRTHISSEEIRQVLVDRAQRYCEAEETSWSAIGLAAVNDSKIIHRIAAGKNFNISTYQRLSAWLDKAEQKAPAA